jgi:hypothetical protein
MIEKKLVEKDVEVTVVEKRVIEVYTFDGSEYLSKEDLVNALQSKGCDLLKDVMDSCRTRNSLAWGTHAATVRRRTDCSDVRSNLDKLKKIVEYYEYSAQFQD